MHALSRLPIAVVEAVLCAVVLDAGAQPPSHLPEIVHVVPVRTNNTRSDPLTLSQFLWAWALTHLVRRQRSTQQHPA